MAREFAVAFYHSKAWKRTRDAYMQRPVLTSKGQCPPLCCERCFEAGELVPAKVVHHITHLNEANINNPEISLAFSNLQRLCQDCHADVHAPQHELRVSFDENGNVIRKVHG